MAKSPATSPRSRDKGQKAAPELSKTQIVETALRLIDEEGLQGFSVRSVAKALGCYPTAIYWYTPSRHFLIAEIVTIILRDVVPTADLGWQDWLRALFTRYRTAIARHPNAAPLIGVNLVSNASVDVDLLEGLLTKLHEAGFQDEGLIDVYNAVVGAMVGFTTQEFAMEPPDADDLQGYLTGFPAKIDAARHPMLARMAGPMMGRSFILRWQNGATRPMDGAFALYVDAFVAGLEVLLRRAER